MSVIPNTEVRLLSNVPLSNSYEHTMTFTDKTAQSDYFKSKSAFTFTDFTYQRDNGSIRVPQSYDSLYNCNYVMYRNNDFSTKWFYAFITKKTYVNPNMTEIEFELDVYQTWQFDMIFNPSFVVREHTKRWNSDGSPVVNTVDEGLNYGTEYKTVKVDRFIPYNNIFYLVIVCTERMDTNGSGVDPTVNGSPQPLTYYVHPFKMDGTTPTVKVDGMNYGLSNINDVLKSLYKQTNAVNNIASMYVTEFFGYASMDGTTFTSDILEPVTIQDSTNSFNTLRAKGLNQYGTLTQNMGDKYSGFTSVDESKLLMYPYTVTVLTDMKGNHQEIKNEYIDDTNIQITVKGSLGTSNKVGYYVNNYLVDGGLSYAGTVALEKAIINNNPNDVPVITDLLSAYLQGNRNSIENSKNSLLFNSVFGAVGNAMTRNVAGAIANAGNSYFEVSGMLAKMKDIDNTPATISKMGSNTYFDYGNDIKGLYIIKKEITDEYRKKLTDFFKMYGYKVNEVKIPNMTSRANYNYVQTVGANITGNIPQDDQEKIREIFNKGVTLWHGDYIGSYSLDNQEV